MIDDISSKSVKMAKSWFHGVELLSKRIWDRFSRRERTRETDMKILSIREYVGELSTRMNAVTHSTEKLLEKVQGMSSRIHEIS